MPEEFREDVQRLVAKRRAALGLSLLNGETSVQEAARKHALTVAEVEGWTGVVSTGRGKRVRKWSVSRSTCFVNLPTPSESSISGSGGTTISGRIRSSGTQTRWNSCLNNEGWWPDEG